MRINIEIDDDLMAQALQITGLSNPKEVVEQGLRLLVKHQKKQALLDLRGQVQWEGDLDKMRSMEIMNID